MQNTLWNLMLTLKEKVKVASSENIQYCHLCLSGRVAINQHLSPNSCTHFFIQLTDMGELDSSLHDAVIRLDGVSAVSIVSRGQLDDATIYYLKLYLPYCFLSVFSKEKGRAISVAHFAQSLDGRVATCKGDSKWIGNQENLVHAHRMRALCDAILIGSGTLEKDQPRLTVRLVTGENPKRVVLGTSVQNYTSLYESSKDRITVIGRYPSHLNGQIDYVHLPTKEKIIHPLRILKYLFAENIHSVYVEGGTTTTSHFIEHQGVDILQLHLAPLLLGGGQSCVDFPGIEMVKQAIRFKNPQFQPFGDAVMFSGELL